LFKSKLSIFWRPLALGITALLGLIIRFYGLDWDAVAGYGTNTHPDERQIMYQVVKLSWPSSWSQFLDQAHSPLNVHFFAYGTFPLYLLATVGNLLSHISPLLADYTHLTLTGRVMNVLFDTGTILLTAWLALLLTPDSTSDRRWAWSVALLASACVAFMPFEVQQTHYYTVDIMLLFFVMLTLLACVKLIRTERPIRWALIAGLGYGLALATKFSAAPLVVPVLIALALRWYHRRDFWDVIVPLVCVVCTTILVFVVAMPYAWLDFNEFWQQVSFQGDLARGMVDLPYVRQFAGTTPYLYELQNMVLWGMGLVLGVVVLAGLLWLYWRLWRLEMGSWLVLLSWVVIYGAINGSFYTKYMRYMLPLYPLLVLMGASMLIWLVSLNQENWSVFWSRLVKLGSYALIALVLLATLFQCLAQANIYSQPNTRVQLSNWIYKHLKPGTVLTYEVWDDAMPVAISGHDPLVYSQATYIGADGELQTGLPLYDDDTTAKAQIIATILMQVGAITMPTDRLDKSIPRLPERYPLTIHYYNLLASGQLGFHLAATFQAHPNFLGITLDDSNADESYSVFDHPTGRVYVRDNPFPFQNAAQLSAKLMEGVQLPPPNPQQTGIQKSLLLSPQQIAADQDSPPFAQQFPIDSPANHWPVFFWWLTLTLLGLLVSPLTFLALRGLADRGYLFAKTLGLFLSGYLCWLLASWHLIAFSRLSTLLVGALLASSALLLVIWLRRTLWAFLRERWRLLLIEECLFTGAFLFLVLIRSLNPDLWNPGLGGEKPMELAFLNGILRSPYMPPLDPWFSGGYINYYYFGYVPIAALIKLTGILPTTAFNLALPTLFALTLSGAFAIVYSFSHRWSLALLASFLVAMLGNLDGAVQFFQQIQALLHNMPIPVFSYWQSSRVIPFTINEFPFWSFLFADLHPHVIAMPLSIFMLGLMGSLFLASSVEGRQEALSRPLFYLLVAFVFGSLICINPWDMPVYALVLGVSLLLENFYARRADLPLLRWSSAVKTLCLYLLLVGLGYFYYWPFYAFYQELYVSGIGRVTRSTSLVDYLHVFGIWLFLLVSFLLLELYRWIRQAVADHPSSVFLARLWQSPAWLRISLYLFASVLILGGLALLGIRVLLGALLALGLLLFCLHGIFSRHALKNENWSARSRYTYLLLLTGLGIGLGIELVYIRDFLDGGDYERMNTFFKFSMQIWLCLGIGSALAIGHIWDNLRGFVKKTWSVLLLTLLLGGSLFLVNGTYSRIQDHQGWIAYQAPTQSANYIPTLDGFAFAHAWYPGDAEAITWLNAHISGLPIILEAAIPFDYTWYSRISVYTGLPDVMGWAGHEGEQRYSDQSINRLTDISLMYTTTDHALALELLNYYHVHYIYVGQLEHLAYAAQTTIGLDKFDSMVQERSLQVVYRRNGVIIYRVL
jgi:YYY domain-containing protein